MPAATQTSILDTLKSAQNASDGTLNVSLAASTGTSVVSDTALELAQASTTSGQTGPLVQGATTTSAPSYTTAKTNPLSLTTAGALRVDNSAVTQPVSGTVTANPAGATTATLSNVNDTNSSTTVLASNANRLGAMFFNDSTSSLYLKLGATASTTSFTVLIAPQGYYELPGPRIYTGIVDGIWSADASGAVRVTEITA